jgi:hypothetical protein
MFWKYKRHAMQVNRPKNSTNNLRSKVEAAGRVDTVREALVELKKLTAEEREFGRLHYLIGMALVEAEIGPNA